MKIATTNYAEELGEWVQAARELFPADIEVHVLAQGYELRCGDMEPFALEAVHTDGAMNTLDIVYHPVVDDMVVMTALVHTKGAKGEAYYVCNRFDDIVAANMVGKKYIAHRVVGMRPTEVQINPDDVSRVEKVHHE